jgi:hypothetical protein
MTMTRMARWALVNFDHYAVKALDGPVKFTAWALKPFTPVIGACVWRWTTGLVTPPGWTVKPWDAWSEAKHYGTAYMLRLGHYELVIDLAVRRQA